VRVRSGARGPGEPRRELVPTRAGLLESKLTTTNDYLSALAEHRLLRPGPDLAELRRSADGRPFIPAEAAFGARLVSRMFHRRSKTSAG
jgi:hypothetical protein